MCFILVSMHLHVESKNKSIPLLLKKTFNKEKMDDENLALNYFVTDRYCNTLLNFPKMSFFFI